MRKWRMRVRIEGLNLEKMMARAAENGVMISDVCRKGGRCMTACVTEDDLPLLRELAQRGGWKLQTEGRYGFGRAAEWIRQRWMLVGALGVGLLLLWASTQLMWGVRLIDAGPYEADLRAWLASCGICPPMLRAQVDPAALRRQLEWRYPRIAWVECGWRGMNLEIRMVEGIIPPETEREAPMDVVASRDCMIDTVLTASGTPLVSPGQIVRKGQILIRGEERSGQGTTKPVAAEGTVLGRVWHAAAVTVPLWETVTAYTGRTSAACVAACPWFDLWAVPKSGYESEDISVSVMPLGGFFLPLTVRTETRCEAEFTRQPVDSMALHAQAEQAALQKLYKNMHAEISLVDKWVNCSMIDNEKLHAVAFGEMLMDVGVQVPSSDMAAAE